MEEFNELKLIDIETDFLADSSDEKLNKLIDFVQKYISKLCKSGDKEKIPEIIEEVYSTLKIRDKEYEIANIIKYAIDNCIFDLKKIINLLREVLNKYKNLEQYDRYIQTLIEYYVKYYDSDKFIVNYVREMSQKTEKKEPISELTNDNSTKWDPIKIAKKLKKELPKYIYGQDHVIEKIVDNFKNNFRDDNLPRATFLFLGPPATGKTYMAEVLSKLIDGYKFKMFNMEQFTHEDGGISLYGSDFKYSKSKPGYLTDFVLKNPESIIVFDEIEKAHPAVQNTLLSIFNNGKLVDKCGWIIENGKYVPFNGKKAEEDEFYPQYPEIQEVDFSKTILIFTSNIGKELYNSGFFWDLVKNDYNRAEDMIIEVLQKEKSITPPFLSRLLSGELLLFKKLDFSSLKKIVKNSFEKYNGLIQKKYNIEFEDLDDFICSLVVLSYAPRIDVRRLKSKVASDFFDVVSDYIIDNDLELDSKRKVKFKISEKVKDYYENNIEPIVKNSDIVKYMFRKNLTLRIIKRADLTEDTFVYRIDEIEFEKVKRVDDFGENGIILDIPDVRFDDIAGQTKVKERLKQIVKLLKNPDKMKKLGIKAPKGMLLYGPPGTGKTMLAKALANEAELPFIATTGTDLLDIKTLEKIFDVAKEYAPSIIFIDEFDAIGNRSKNDGREIVINKLLSKINGFNDESDIFVIAATNYPQNIDPALLRSGRVDLTVEVKALDKEARRFFIQKIINNFKKKEDFNINKLVVYTTGMNGSDLEKVKREVGLEMIKRDDEYLTEELLIEIINTVKYGERIDIDISSVLESTAIHEAGHAVISKILNPEIAIEQITITPRNRSLGFVAYSNENNYKNLTKEDIKNKLQILLAGRYAQIKKYGEKGLDSGASNDLEKAINLIYKAITEFGMDDEIKNLNLEKIPNSQIYFKEKIEVRILEWLKESENNVKQTVEENWNKIQTVANVLLEKETLDEKELVEIIKKENSSE